MPQTHSTILVTGGCGYLGSQLIRDLVTDAHFDGCKVRILDNLRQGQVHALMDLPGAGRYEFIEGDILDPALLHLALQDVDAVIHLAAVVRTPLSFENPAWIEQVNHWGTAHLVEACLAAQVQRLIFTSTSVVYGPGGPHAETDSCHPQGAYAQSKLAAEQNVVGAIERGLPATILRLGTIYGLAPIMRFDAVTNRFSYLAGVRRALTVYGGGQQRRPLIHVRDASAAIRIVLAVSPPEPIFNAVSASVSVLELIEAIRRAKPDVEVHYTEQDIRTHFSFAATNTALLATGWRPTVDLADGVYELLNHFTSLERIAHFAREVDE